MLYAGLTLAAVLAGYLLVLLVAGSPTEKPVKKGGEEEGREQPWYQRQAPPPSMITSPDLPLFPDTDASDTGTGQDVRAYEEALPKETYEPPEAGVPAQPPETLGPVADDAGLPRWRRFAVAPRDAADGDRPLIALVIDDMGVDRKRSAQAIGLKAPLTLSFLTYAPQLARQTERAREKGHELMLHVAMEPGSKVVDPGPNALLTDLSDEELRRRLEWGFGRFDTYVGVNNHMGSKFTADRRAMSIVMEEIKKRGLLFLDSRTSGRTVGAAVAREMGVPVAERNIFLDHDNSVEAVNARLREVERMARRTGQAVAIGHPRDATIKALRAWLTDIEEKGFLLVPLSAIVARNGAS